MKNIIETLQNKKSEIETNKSERDRMKKLLFIIVIMFLIFGCDKVKVPLFQEGDMIRHNVNNKLGIITTVILQYNNIKGYHYLYFVRFDPLKSTIRVKHFEIRHLK